MQNHQIQKLERLSKSWGWPLDMKQLQENTCPTHLSIISSSPWTVSIPSRSSTSSSILFNMYSTNFWEVTRPHFPHTHSQLCLSWVGLVGQPQSGHKILEKWVPHSVRSRHLRTRVFQEYCHLLTCIFVMSIPWWNVYIFGATLCHNNFCYVSHVCLACRHLLVMCLPWMEMIRISQ